MLFRQSLEHTVWNLPLGVAFMVDGGKAALNCSDLGFQPVAPYFLCRPDPVRRRFPAGVPSVLLGRKGRHPHHREHEHIISWAGAEGHPYSRQLEVMLSRGFSDHRADFILEVAEASQNLGSMFAEKGWRQAVAHGRRRKADGVGDAFGRADGRMFELDDQAPSVSLCGVHGFGNRVDGSGGNFCGGEFL